jgi:hypothetical protein
MVVIWPSRCLDSIFELLVIWITKLLKISIISRYGFQHFLVGHGEKKERVRGGRGTKGVVVLECCS